MPPPLPGAKTAELNRARIANLLLPGAGLYLLGDRKLGVFVAAVFLGSFVAVLTLFFFGYANYLTRTLEGDLMQGDNLERISDGFHFGWLLACAGIGTAIYLVGIILFMRARARVQAGAEA
jgi:hypothetical protein